MKFNQQIIKGVIFDLDGILVDTEYFHWQGWVEVLKQYGKSLSKQEYFNYAGKHGEIIERELMEAFNLSLATNTLLEKKQQFVTEWLETRSLQSMPFAKEAVQYFHN